MILALDLIEHVEDDLMAIRGLAKMLAPSGLDRSFRAIVPAHLGTMLEVCCGAGEAFTLFHDRIGRGIGIDVSSVMLEAARRNHPGEERLIVQGDATRIPLADESVDAVMFLGGIHHVNDRSNRRFCWTASDGCYWPSTEAASACDVPSPERCRVGREPVPQCVPHLRFSSSHVSGPVTEHAGFVVFVDAGQSSGGEMRRKRKG